MRDPSMVYTETGTGARLEGWEQCEPGWRAWRTAMRVEILSTQWVTVRDGRETTTST